MNRRTLLKATLGASAAAPIAGLSHFAHAGQLEGFLASLTNIYVSEGLRLPKAEEGQFRAVAPNSFEDNAVGFILHNNTDKIVQVNSVGATGTPDVEGSHSPVSYSPDILAPGDYAIGFGEVDSFDGSRDLGFTTNINFLDDGEAERVLKVEDVTLVGDKVEVVLTNQHDTNVGPDVNANVAFFNEEGSHLVGICPTVITGVDIPAGETFRITISNPIGETTDQIAACAEYGHST